jgi:tRNA modification GTPase
VVVFLGLPGETVPSDLGETVIHVIAKSDINCGQPNAVSGLTGEGIDALITKIEHELQQKSARAGIAMRERHRLALIKANESLETAMALIDTNTELADLIAEEIRTAVRAVESLVGRVDVEDLLDVIFSSFCIGK